LLGGRSDAAALFFSLRTQIMAHHFAELMFTDGVKAEQESYGSRARLQRFSEMAGPNDELSSREASFIAERDTFYLATVNDDGWPYVQHRGGPPGFLRVLGPKKLAYADFRGNTQLVSVGNVTTNDRVSLILMDYPNRKRLKILGHMRVENAKDVPAKDLAEVELPDYRALVERVVYIEVAAFDWNCPQYITQRYTESEWADQQETQ
jgi:predicted pyridoxine 5'-phosphate oxidase superfamily flavin-nucleotide-binding protein